MNVLVINAELSILINLKIQLEFWSPLIGRTKN